MADTLVATYTEEEVEKRVLILRRLREALLTQRGKFRSYLSLLEKEEEAILNDDVETLEHQMETEHAIVSEIITMQRAILPLEELFQKAYPDREVSISRLEKSLESVKSKVLERNNRNRSLLREKMAVLRQEIKSLRKGFRSSSPFGRIGMPTLVDLTT